MPQGVLLASWLLVALGACRFAPPLQGPAPRYPAIEGLRGLLALMVVWSHGLRMLTLMPRPGVPYWSPLFAEHQPFHNLGSLAVAFFFCVTGFLFWERRAPADLSKFLRGRVRRLTPAFLALAGLAAFLTGLLILAGAESLGWLTRVKQLLSFATFGFTDLTVHPSAVVTMGMAWSLAYEWAFYLALPLLWVLRAHSRLLPHGVFLVFCAYALAGPARHIALFLWAGMLVAEATPFLLGALNERVRVWLSWSAVPLFGAWAVAGTFDFQPRALPLVAALFLTVTLAVPGRGPLAGFSALARLGQMAYSLYLVHGVVLFLLFLPLVPMQDTIGPRSFELWVGISTIAAIGAARGWYHFFERKFIHANS